MDVHPALVEMLASVLPMKAELRIAAPVGSGRRSAEHASKVSPWTFSSRDFGMGAAIIILNDKGGIELRDSAYEPIRKIARSFGIGWLPSVPYSFEVPGWETQVFNKLKIDRRLK